MREPPSMADRPPPYSADYWTKALDAAEKREHDFLKTAKDAYQLYASESTNNNYVRKGLDYNILFANVETLIPAVLNSSPLPDIRRRFDNEDQAAGDVAEIFERGINYFSDDGALLREMEACVRDALVAGRGVVRIRLKIDEQSEDTGYAAPTDTKRPREKVCYEAVSYKDFRFGYGARWDDVQWVAFRHWMDQEAIGEFVTKEIEISSPSVNTDNVEEVWEIWCKKTKMVYFLNKGKPDQFWKQEDPLQLSTFFPVTAPIQPIEVTGEMTPICPYSVYEALAKELDLITRRIRHIIKEIRVRGGYLSDSPDLKAAIEAQEGEFVAISNVEAWLRNGGFDNAIFMFPIDRFIQTLRELYTARDQIKQTIYEITGIADIVRGSSSASETLGAQQIKVQWGEIRILRLKRLIADQARELFVKTAEIMGGVMSVDVIQQITNLPLVPTPMDPPEVQARKMQTIELLKSTFSYRINVETDSTSRASQAGQKGELLQFMQAAAQYFGAVAPLVQQGQMPPSAAAEIFGSVSRLFNLGKTVEDTVNGMVDKAKQMEQQAPQEKPNPDQMKAEAELSAKQQEMQMRAQAAQVDMMTKQQELQFKTQESQSKMAADSQDQQIKAQQAESELSIKIQEAQIILQIEQAKLEQILLQNDLLKVKIRTEASSEITENMI